MAHRMIILPNEDGVFLGVNATALFVLIMSDISQTVHSLFDGQNIKNNKVK